VLVTLAPLPWFLFHPDRDFLQGLGTLWGIVCMMPLFFFGLPVGLITAFAGWCRCPTRLAKTTLWCWSVLCLLGAFILVLGFVMEG
jgi:hypothetical protein